MHEKNPRIKYLCPECNEWSSLEDYLRSPYCQQCKRGTLEKRCSWCTMPIEECNCDKTMLDSLCHKCGVEKEYCKCLI